MITSNKLLSNKIVSSSLIITGFTVAAALLAFFLRIFYSRSLSIEMYGLFYAVMAFYGFFTPFQDLGLGYGLTYFIPKFIRQKNNTSIWLAYKYTEYVTIAVSMFISVIVFILSPWLAKFYFKISLAEPVIKITIIYFITNGVVFAFNKLYNGLQKEIYYASLDTIKLVLVILFSFIFFINNKGNVYHYALAWSLTYLVLVVFYRILLHIKHRHLRTRVIFHKPLIVSMFKYSLPTLMATSVATIFGSIDILFITILIGVKSVGIYNIVLPIVSVSNIILSPLKAFFLPLVSHLIDDEKEKVEYIVDMILKYIPFVTFYFGLFIIIFAPVIVRLIFGPQWGNEVIVPLKILVIGYSFSNLSAYLIVISSGMGFARERLKNSLILAVINVFMSFISIKFFGLIGAAFANLCIYFFSVVLYGYIIKRKINFKYPVWFYLKIVIFGIFVYTIIDYTNIAPSNWMELIVTGIVYTLFFTLFGFYLKLINGRIVRTLIGYKK